MRSELGRLDQRRGSPAPCPLCMCWAALALWQLAWQGLCALIPWGGPTLGLGSESRLDWGPSDSNQSLSPFLYQPCLFCILLFRCLEPCWLWSKGLSQGWAIHFFFYIKKIYFWIFNWKIIALHCCVGFYHSSTWIMHKCICPLALEPSSLVNCAQFFSCVGLFATPWLVARQAPPSMENFQARILEWVPISYCRGSSRPTDLVSSSR